jgi:parallel beta helix pectate lyase-like protein
VSLRSLLVALGATVALVALAPVANAAIIHVHQGQSIQAAIDNADPGDTIVVAPGVYRENLTISENHITLRGTIGRERRTVLKPAETPTPSFCTQDSSVNGICAVGEIDANGNPGAPIVGTRIKGFVVNGFSGFGIALFNAKHTTVSWSRALNNEGYGISGFALEEVWLLHNVAHHNGEPGFYIGDSPDADAVVIGNRSHHNVGGEGDGFLFRDASEGIVRNNRAWDNCSGFIFVDSGENPDPLSDWRATGNVARHNNASCTGEAGGPPPISGIGIALIGSDHVVLRENVVRGNSPTGPSPLGSGGIIVVDSTAIGGAAPTANRIIDNIARHNSPFDISWDESGTGNVFRNNHCGVSDPAWICD